MPSPQSKPWLVDESRPVFGRGMLCRRSDGGTPANTTICVAVAKLCCFHHLEFDLDLDLWFEAWRRTRSFLGQMRRCARGTGQRARGPAHHAPGIPARPRRQALGTPGLDSTSTFELEGSRPTTSSSVHREARLSHTQSLEAGQRNAVAGRLALAPVQLSVPIGEGAGSYGDLGLRAGPRWHASNPPKLGTLPRAAPSGVVASSRSSRVCGCYGTIIARYLRPCHLPAATCAGRREISLTPVLGHA